MLGEVFYQGFTYSWGERRIKDEYIKLQINNMYGNAKENTQMAFF